MKNILTFLTLALVWATQAWAGDAVIWGTSGFGRFLPASGFELSSSAGLKQYRNLTVDPTGGTVPAPIGSVGVRDNAGSGEIWFKYGAADPAWTNLLSGVSGWALTGNAATNAAVNYIGTTDAVDFVVRTNATERARFTQGATPTLQLSSIEAISNGNVGAVASSFNSLNFDHTFTSTVANNVYGPYITDNFQGAVSGGYYGFTSGDTWETGSSVSNWTALLANPDMQAGSTIGDVTVINANPQIAAGTMAGSTYTGAVYGGTMASDMTGHNGINLTPNISGAVGFYNGFTDNPQWGATSSMPAGGRNFSAQPSVSTGATYNSGIGFFSSATVASGVTISDWTGFQDNSDIDSAISAYTAVSLNPQGSGDHTNVNMVSASPSLSGNQTNVNGFSFTGTVGNNVTTFSGANINPTATGTVTNWTGATIAGTATVTNSPYGLSVNMSNLTTSSRKFGLGITSGLIQQTGSFTTTSSFPAVVDSGNLLNPTFSIASGSPISDTDVVANNFAVTKLIEDDYTSSVAFGLGIVDIGFVGQTSVLSGVTVEKMSQAVAGGVAPASSTGGTITDLYGFRSAGLLNGGGTVVATNQYGFYVDSGFDPFATNSWGIYVADASAGNYFAGEANADGGFRLSTGGAQPTCNSGNRGKLWNIQGGAGVADNYEICQKDASDVYAWTPVGATDLSNYLYKPGLSGGQTATGGTDASDNLVLRSTTNATKGQVYLDETTASTSPTTGALRVDGGVGVGGSVYAAGSVTSDTSLVLNNAGDTFTQTRTAGGASYSVAWPNSQGAANTVPLNDGSGNLSWTSLVPQQFGTRQTGRSIVAGTGITSGASHMSTTAIRQTVYVVGNGSAPADISASPQIEAGTLVGQEMEVCGTDDTAYVLLEQDVNLQINGAASLTKDRCLTLVWRGTDGTNAAWGEKSRNF